MTCDPSARGAAPVGVRTITVHRNRPLPVEIWYPADEAHELLRMQFNSPVFENPDLTLDFAAVAEAMGPAAELTPEKPAARAFLQGDLTAAPGANAIDVEVR